MFNNTLASSRAWKFILLMGFVSLLADMTYEGARSIVGPYFQILGASALAVSIVAGLGEFLGYALRMVSGYWIDKTQRYWPIAFLGYTINLLAVPLLALTSHWYWAAALYILERVGKAMRVPARDAMLSYAGQNTGLGKGFGIHEAMDRVGAMLGPLIVAAIFYKSQHYQIAFASLLVPAVLALITLVLAARLFPHPRDLEVKTFSIGKEHLDSVFWVYVAATSCVAIAYVDFPLFAFHMAKVHTFAPVWIPIIYAFSLGLNGFIAPWLGHLFDKYGIKILPILIVVTAGFAPLIFFGKIWMVVVGVILWSVGLSGQNTIMRAFIGQLIAPEKRGSAYGIFNASFGFAWFAGSAVIGLLYMHSLVAVSTFTIVFQLLAIPPLIWVIFKTK